jgi:hypothetical protein
MAVVAAVATAVVGTAVGGAVQAGKQHKAMRRARNEKEAAKWKVEELQANRQEITNPFAGVQSLSSMASDLSGQMSNPYASLGVATQAAEIQMEQSDIALANSLDAMMATGASAGGATALAQAALRSKKGVAAGIEAQEATNEKLRAEGEAKLQQARINEQQRLQSIAISEGQRVQAAEAQGNIFEFHAQEDRTNADLAYNIAKETGAQQRQTQARANRDSATSGIFTGIGSIASSVATAGLTGGLGPSTGPSDRRMKKNIKLIGKSNSGLNIYAFEYIDKIFGEGTWQGVMSNEVSKEAVIKNFTGNFDGVDYSKIDVEFKRIS